MAYYLFVSHAWRYDESYERIVQMLDAAPYFSWSNFSVPRHDPAIASNTSALKVQLDNQIRPVQVVLVLSGLYVAHSQWIQYEIDRAVGWKKPIIGVRPWGNQRMPEAVTKVANKIVGWNTSPIVEAVRELA